MNHMSKEEDNFVQIPMGDLTLDGSLVVPRYAEGAVIFAHGSGSSRFSRRNRYVADVLESVGLATLLMDLLTREEEEVDMMTGHLRFNVGMLSDRLIGATDWLQSNPLTENLNIGYFGSSTGAGAALIAAVKKPEAVQAVVSRGGRPDLARQYLPLVRSPTLLIVGGYDTRVIEINEEALAHLKTTKMLEIIPGASHLFEEPGKLVEVAKLAAGWFTRFITQSIG